MDAQMLFRQGVAAIRERKDMAQGQQYLIQSLRLEPRNEMGWLWLSHTYSDPQKQIACLDRVLRLNPQNERALARKRQLLASSSIKPITRLERKTRPKPAQPRENASFLTASPPEPPQTKTESFRFEDSAAFYSAEPVLYFDPTDTDSPESSTSDQSDGTAPNPELSPEDRRHYKRLLLSKGSKAAITIEETLHRRGYDWDAAHSLTQKLTMEATHEAELKSGLFNLISGITLIVVAFGLSFGSATIFAAMGFSGCYVAWIGMGVSGLAQAGHGIRLLFRAMSD